MNEHIRIKGVCGFKDSFKLHQIHIKAFDRLVIGTAIQIRFIRIVKEPSNWSI